MPKLRRRPIITLTTDFGIQDPYVAEMKGVLLQHCPDAQLVDVTHQIPAQDVVGGSLALDRILGAFPARTIHLAVVDPGVGSGRKLLVWKACRQVVVCPDNGLITWPARRREAGKVFELTYRPAPSSNTFHGRDILAPVAGLLAAGYPLLKLARPSRQAVLLDLAPSTDGSGRIIHFDHFGNATTNIPAGLAGRNEIHVKGKPIGPLRKTYSDVGSGKSVALVESSGLIEIAVRNGSAAMSLKLKLGDPVHIG
jgi:S-adenosylmethionine hydrolase